MSGLDISALQDSILEYLETALPAGYQVLESDVTDALTIVQQNGLAQTIVIVQFGDLLPRAGDKSWCGPEMDGYYTLIRTLCIASSAKRARQANSVVNQVLIGHKPPNGGAIAKQAGGGAAILGESNSKPLAFVALAGFTLATNVDDVGSTVYP